MDDWVFVDTCVWAAFFARPGSAEKAAVDRLLDQDRVALVGPVIAEILIGFRVREQADWVASRLRLAHVVGRLAECSRSGTDDGVART